PLKQIKQTKHGSSHPKIVRVRNCEIASSPCIAHPQGVSRFQPPANGLSDGKIPVCRSSLGLGYMADPYTIRIFVPYGNPEGLRIIDRMNWTGLGIAFPREDWPKIKLRSEFTRAGVYILVGPTLGVPVEAGDDDGGEDLADDLPTIYIGQADVVRARL